MKYITDMNGAIMPVHDVAGCIKQVAVILENDFQLSETEKQYWLSIASQLHSLSK